MNKVSAGSRWQIKCVFLKNISTFLKVALEK